MVTMTDTTTGWIPASLRKGKTSRTEFDYSTAVALIFPFAQAFSSAAYRFGHSLLPSTVERWTPGHKFIGTQRLSEMLQQPYDLFKPGWLDRYVNMCA